LFENYRFDPGPPLAFPVHAFGGSHDRRVGSAELEPWRAQTAATFHLQQFSGGHFFIQDSVEPVLKAISDVALGAR
jgi:surfactin synthase thioesterase subunit